MALDGFYLQELDAIAINETGGGINLNHVELTKGIHKGTRAGGNYGLMPWTVVDLIKASPVLKRRYEDLLLMSPNEITEVLNENPKISRDIALVFWKDLRENFKFDPSRAAFAWLHGPYAAQKASEDKVLGNDYVKKFMETLYWNKNRDDQKTISQKS